MGGLPKLKTVPSVKIKMDSGLKTNVASAVEGSIIQPAMFVFGSSASVSNAIPIPKKRRFDEWDVVANVVQYLRCMDSPTELVNFDHIHHMWRCPVLPPTSFACLVPMIDINIGGERLKALFDTGAGTCVMDRKTMDLLKMKPMMSEMSVTSCTESPLSVVGEVRIEVGIADRRYMQRFVVVEHLTHSIILGADIIMAMGIVPLLHAGEYCFGDELARRYPFSRTRTARGVSGIATVNTSVARKVKENDLLIKDDKNYPMEGDNELSRKKDVDLLTKIEEDAMQRQIIELSDQLKSFGLRESELPNSVKVGELPNQVKIVELPEDNATVVDLTANVSVVDLTATEKVVVAGLKIVELIKDKTVVELPIHDKEEERLVRQILDEDSKMITNSQEQTKDDSSIQVMTSDGDSMNGQLIDADKIASRIMKHDQIVNRSEMPVYTSFATYVDTVRKTDKKPRVWQRLKKWCRVGYERKTMIPVVRDKIGEIPLLRESEKTRVASSVDKGSVGVAVSVDGLLKRVIRRKSGRKEMDVFRRKSSELEEYDDDRLAQESDWEEKYRLPFATHEARHQINAITKERDCIDGLQKRNFPLSGLTLGENLEDRNEKGRVSTTEHCRN